MHTDCVLSRRSRYRWNGCSSMCSSTLSKFFLLFPDIESIVVFALHVHEYYFTPTIFFFRSSSQHDILSLPIANGNLELTNTVTHRSSNFSYALLITDLFRWFEWLLVNARVWSSFSKHIRFYLSHICHYTMRQR